MRYLGLFVGHGAYAQVLVLVIFLGGMSLGAARRRAAGPRRCASRCSGTPASSSRWGSSASSSTTSSSGRTHLAYDSIFPALGPAIAHSVAKWTLAALLILPQSILLGATFPLMSAGVLRRAPERVGEHALAPLLREQPRRRRRRAARRLRARRLVGLPGTLLVAAMVNLVVALARARRSRAAAMRRRGRAVARDGSDRARRSRRSPCRSRSRCAGCCSP